MAVVDKNFIFFSFNMNNLNTKSKHGEEDNVIELVIITKGINFIFKSLSIIKGGTGRIRGLCY